MKKSRFTESQIVKAIKEYEAGRPMADICQNLGIQSPTFYDWNMKCSGMSSQELARLKELKEENRRLKQMPACPAGRLPSNPDGYRKNFVS